MTNTCKSKELTLKKRKLWGFLQKEYSDNFCLTINYKAYLSFKSNSYMYKNMSMRYTHGIWG